MSLCAQLATVGESGLGWEDGLARVGTQVKSPGGRAALRALQQVLCQSQPLETVDAALRETLGPVAPELLAPAIETGRLPEAFRELGKLADEERKRRWVFLRPGILVGGGLVVLSVAPGTVGSVSRTVLIALLGVGAVAGLGLWWMGRQGAAGLGGLDAVHRAIWESGALSAWVRDPQQVRMFRMMATGLESGMGAEGGLRMAAQGCTQPEGRRRLGQALGRMRGGEDLATSLCQAGLLSSEQAAQLETGEHIGQVPETLESLAVAAELLAQRRRERFTKAVAWAPYALILATALGFLFLMAGAL